MGTLGFYVFIVAHKAPFHTQLNTVKSLHETFKDKRDPVYAASISRRGPGD